MTTPPDDALACSTRPKMCSNAAWEMPHGPAAVESPATNTRAPVDASVNGISVRVARR
jgi:hypothetical protein